MSYLQTITPFTQADNLGGLIELRVARAADIELIGQPVNGTVYGTITFKPGRGFVTWAVTHESAGTDSQGSNTREGMSKGNRLKFSIPKDRPAIRAMLEAAADDELVVLYRDANGRQKLFGTKETPVRFRFNYATGVSLSGKNGYDGEFWYDGPGNIYDYNGSITTAPAGPAPAVVRFNNVVIGTLQPGEQLNIESDYSYNQYFVTT